MQTVTVTKGTRDLVFPSSTPPGEQWIYQLAMPFQLSPTEAGLIVNIRLGKTRVVDLEVGSDLVIFDNPNHITAERAVALNRCRYETHPRTGEKLMMIAGPAGGAFVPLGAKRPDGSAHPHAGTGFGLGPLQGYPTALADLPDTHINCTSDVHMRIELLQYAYDGRTFAVTHRQELPSDGLLPGTHVMFLSMGMGIPSGDDLLTGINTGNFGAWDSGIARWRRGSDGRWAIIDYQLLAPATHEPSLVRDTDGSLLILFRPWPGTNKEPMRLHMRRSTDEGKTWKRICAVEPFWHTCPTTLNRSLDGRPYVCSNRFREPRVNPHASREMLWLWPLSDDRQRLLDPIVVRDGSSEWGATPNGSVWRLDHPMGATVRLKDGKWHHVLAYRVLDDAEMRTDAGATPMTGCYVEEVFSPGEPIPTWLF